MKAMLIAIPALLLSGLASVQATTKTITLPADTMELESSELPGYAKARANCLTCHSAEYMRYQPTSAPRPYWEAMVKRMKSVFNAPIDDADVPDLVDYLVRVYGAERKVPRMSDGE
jgi:hypothetical protein